MDMFEAIEAMKKSSSELEKILSIPDISKSYIQPIEVDQETSPFVRQARLLQEIAANTQLLGSQAAELKRIADSAEKSAALAEKEAESAKKDALFSKIVSVLALLVSAGSLAVAIVALAVR